MRESPGKRRKERFAGLCRSLWPYSTPAVTVDDVTLVTGVEGPTGNVDYAFAVYGGDGTEGVSVVLKGALAPKWPGGMASMALLRLKMSSSGQTMA
jgi:hypothetical protein